MPQHGTLRDFCCACHWSTRSSITSACPSIRERYPFHRHKKSIEQIRFSGYYPALFFGVVPADPVADDLTPVPKFDGNGLSVSGQSRLDRRPFPVRKVHVRKY